MSLPGGREQLARRREVVLGTEPEWDKIRLQNRVRRVPVRRDHTNAALEAEHRMLQAEYATLKQAHIRLQEADRLRQDLVDMLVHDLKNPLSVVLASLEVLSDTLCREASEEMRELVRIASYSGQEMLQIITDLLEVKRLESGTMPIRLQPLDVATVLQTTAAQAQLLASQKRVNVCLCIPDGLPWVWADLSLMSRLLTNLLDNAIHFSPQDGTVVVAVRVGKKEVTVSVTNHGPVISAEHQERIFDKFYQADRNPGQERGCVGLGLSFCKLAVEAQRGRIWVESDGGIGTRFHFTLPTWQ
jgi:signal transduction histidine kinase